MATGPAVDVTPEAFERLYRRHVADVYRYALAMVRDPSEAEDLTQATFLRAWRAFRDGTTPRTPQNWFLRIAHNVLRTHFRDRARRPREVELPASVEAAAPTGPTAADVLDALAELPVNQREALVMRELEGRSYAEIAEILGVSRSAVEALIFRARRSLRVHRSDLRRLGVVQVPASVASFVRDRSVAETVGAVVGASGVVKAAAVVAAGVVAIGAGKEVVDTVAEPPSAAPAVSVDARPKLPPLAAVRRSEGVLPRAAPPPQAVATTTTVPVHAAASTAATVAEQPAAPPPSPAPASPRAPAPSAPVVAHEPVEKEEETPVVERVEAIVDDAEEDAPLPELAAEPPLEAAELPAVLEEPLPELPVASEETPLPSLP